MPSPKPSRSGGSGHVAAAQFTGCSRPGSVIHRASRPRTSGVTALIDTPDVAPDGQVSRRRAPWWWGALAGLLAVGAALAVGELVTGILEGTSSAVVSVGEVVVANAPNWLKEFAIETFGENDKDALIAGTTITLVLVSIVLGVASVRRLWIGIAGTVAFGVIGVWAALTRPVPARSTPGPRSSAPSPVSPCCGSSSAAPAPPRRRAASPVGTVAGVGARPVAGADRRARAPARDPRPPCARPGPAPRPRPASTAGRSWSAPGWWPAVRWWSAPSARASRAATAWPAPAPPSPSRRPRRPPRPSPPGSSSAPPASRPFITPNADFYRVDTALQPPRVTPVGVAPEHRRHGRQPDRARPSRTSSTARSSSATSPWSASPTRSAAATPAPPAGSACRSPPCSTRPACRPAPTSSSAARSTAGPPARRCRP